MEENTTVDISAINEKIAKESAFVDALMGEMNKVIVGQKHMVERLIIGLLGQGHILLEKEALVEFNLRQTYFLQM
jgi:MoxR-like ATPase